MTMNALVMPKLGLTMTEGTIVRWAVAVGAPFTAGDVVAVVETDKIAYDVEAPAAGKMHELLVPEGSAVPVGTPIAHWDLAGEPASAAAALARNQAPAETIDSTARPAVAAPRQAESGRTIATPYARRLAREAALDLASIRSGDPRGRIKAADVVRAIGARDAVPSLTPSARASNPVIGFIATKVDVTRLERLLDEMGPYLAPKRAALAHIVVLAAARAWAASESRPSVVGFAADGSSRRIVTFEASAGLRLSDVLAPAGEGSAPGGVLVVSGFAQTSFVAFAPPPGWSACLGVGGVQRVLVPDEADRPLVGRQVELTLAVRDETMDIAVAQELLARVRECLEHPLRLLVA